MRNKYLLLGAASALMLAACSEDIKQGPEVNNPAKNALNLTSLDAASQAGRVSLPGQTRGPKADRLQLVAKIAPVSTAADQKWSATGIAIANGNAYVSWHSDHQAKVPAESWGGALDALSISELSGLNGAINPENVITSTLTSTRVKFNNVVAAGTNLYFPLTCYNNGAVVGRLSAGAEVMDTIGIPGSSANAIYVDGTTLYAATGYAGGVYSMPVSFNDDTKFDTEDATNRIVEVAKMTNSFGGKYITDGTVLRTDDKNAYLLPLNGGSERTLDVPLVSAQKYAEAYDPVKNEWYELAGETAAYYGKHTMSKSGDFTYIGAGKNGLRVYAATSDAVWNNNTNTTAVTVAEVDGTKYVFAATGAGLRVYNEYNSESKTLDLFAFEVKNYNNDGTAADAPNANQPEAGTDAHSSNFVAVDSETGLIFVANGQSGVYVFKLNTTVEPNKVLTGFITDLGDGVGNDLVDEDGEAVDFEVPAGPVVEGKNFEKWVDKDGNEYEVGQKQSFNPGDKIELIAVYNVTVTFKYNDTETPVTIAEGATVDATQFPTNSSVTAPEDQEFKGAWVIEGTETPFTSQTEVEKNINVVPVFVAHVYSYILHFDGNKEGVTVSNLPGDVKSDDAKVKVPDMTPTVPEGTPNPAFIGWATDPEMSVAHKDAGLWTPIMPGDNFTCTSAETTLYAIWATNATAGGNAGGEVEEPKPNQGNGAGGSDSGSGTM